MCVREGEEKGAHTHTHREHEHKSYTFHFRNKNLLQKSLDMGQAINVSNKQMGLVPAALTDFVIK